MKVSMWSTMKHCGILEILSTMGRERLFQRLFMPKYEDFENLPTSAWNRTPCEHVSGKLPLSWSSDLGQHILSCSMAHPPGPCWVVAQERRTGTGEKMRRDLEKHIPALTCNSGILLFPLYVGDQWLLLGRNSWFGDNFIIFPQIDGPWYFISIYLMTLEKFNQSPWWGVRCWWSSQVNIQGCPSISHTVSVGRDSLHYEDISLLSHTSNCKFI